jgi:hypothetical protein
MKRLFVLLLCVASLSVGLVACGKSEADQKMADDIAKIREIKEKEQADLAKQEKEHKEFVEGMKKGAAAPLREIK